MKKRKLKSGIHWAQTALYPFIEIVLGSLGDKMTDLTLIKLKFIGQSILFARLNANKALFNTMSPLINPNITQFILVIFNSCITQQPLFGRRTARAARSASSAIPGNKHRSAFRATCDIAPTIQRQYLAIQARSPRCQTQLRLAFFELQ